MPRAYELLIGLTEVDPESPFYRNHFHGFDGRRGCEGCATDVRKMRELTHYLGFEPVTLEPLLNERATRARVRGMLEFLADPQSGIKNEDIVLIYLSCHGRTLGGVVDPPTVKSTAEDKRNTDPDGVKSQFVSLKKQTKESKGIGANESIFATKDEGGDSAYNFFLLYDAPIFNVEIWLPFIRRQLLLQAEAKKTLNTESPCESSSIKLRLFVMVDACHAGIGLGGLKAIEPHLEEAKKIVLLSLQMTPGGIEFLNQYLLDAELRSLKSATTGFSLARGLEEGFLQSVELTYFGAARDELTAAGGSEGSLFTRRFRQLFLNGGDQMKYPDFFTALREILPGHHQPVMFPNPERVSGEHFCHQTVLQIQPDPRLPNQNPP